MSRMSHLILQLRQHQNHFQKMIWSLFIAFIILEAEAATLSTLEDACPRPDSKGITSFLIEADSPIGKINTMLIKFDTKRHLPISSTYLQDNLNSVKEIKRGKVVEPFGPVSETCPTLSVPSIQFNCTGGISMTKEQRAKAKPRYTWDRGHLTPANIMRFSTDALSKTFYCVNLAPQDSWTNQNPWKIIELKTENKLKLTKGYVMTGVCSEDNIVDGPTTYKGYTIPKCFWKLACYKDAVTKKTRVVGFVGDNTIVNFKDTAAQEERTRSTLLPRSQAEIRKLLTKSTLISKGWKDAEKYLRPGRQLSSKDLPTASQCTRASKLPAETLAEWQDFINA